MNSTPRNLTAIAAVLVVLTTFAAASDGPGATVDRYFEAYRSMDLAALAAVYAPDAVFVDVLQRHRTEGRDAIRDNVAGLAAVHLAMDVREEERVVTGNRVAVRFVYTGTISGEALRRATGKTTCRDTKYEVPATSWFEISNGQVVRQTDFIDVTALKEAQVRASGQVPE